MVTTQEYLQKQVKDAVSLYRNKLETTLVRQEQYIKAGEAIHAFIGEFKEIDKDKFGDYDKVLDALFITYPILKLLLSLSRLALRETPSETEATKSDTKKPDSQKPSTPKPQPKAEGSHKLGLDKAPPNEEDSNKEDTHLAATKKEIDSNLGPFQDVDPPKKIEEDKKAEAEAKASEMKAKYAFFNANEFVEKLAQFIDGLFEKTSKQYKVTLTEKFKKDVCDFMVCNLVVFLEKSETSSTSEFKVDDVIMETRRVGGNTQKKIEQMKKYYSRSSQSLWLDFFNEGTLINGIQQNVIDYVASEGEIELDKLILSATDEKTVLKKVLEQIEDLETVQAVAKAPPPTTNQTEEYTIWNTGKKIIASGGRKITRGFYSLTDDSARIKKIKIIFFLNTLHKSWEGILTDSVFEQLRRQAGEENLQRTASGRFGINSIGDAIRSTPSTSDIVAKIAESLKIKAGNKVSVDIIADYYGNEPGNLISLKEAILKILTEKELPKGFMAALEREINKRKNMTSTEHTTQDEAASTKGTSETTVQPVEESSAGPEEAQTTEQTVASVGEPSSAHTDDSVERKEPDSPTARSGVTPS